MHTIEEIEKFQQGETRHVYAAYKDGSPGLFYLEDGEADQHRAFAKELRCAFDSCESPELTVHARSGKRDGFAHRNSPELGHSPESEFHLAAKGIIQRWAQAQNATVEAVQERYPDGSRERRADVLVTWPTGAHVAFEPQYSALSLDSWRGRHNWYAEHGIPDVWLFGHVGKQLRVSGQDRLVKLNDVQRAQAEHGPVLWISPHEEKIATLDVTGEKRRRGAPIKGTLVLIPVRDCILTPAGIQHPEIDRCHTALSLLLAEPEDEERPQNADFAWAEDSSEAIEESARQENAWAQARAAAATQQKARAEFVHRTAEPPHQPRRQLSPTEISIDIAWRFGDTLDNLHTAFAAGEEWLTTDEGRQTLTRLGGDLRWAMQKAALPLPAHQWQSFVYEQYVLPVTPGTVIDMDALSDAVFAEFLGCEIPGTATLYRATARREVEAWFQHAATVAVGRLGPHAFTRMRS